MSPTILLTAVIAAVAAAEASQDLFTGKDLFLGQDLLRRLRVPTDIPDEHGRRTSVIDTRRDCECTYPYPRNWPSCPCGDRPGGGGYGPYYPGYPGWNGPFGPFGPYGPYGPYNPYAPRYNPYGPGGGQQPTPKPTPGPVPYPSKTNAFCCRSPANLPVNQCWACYPESIDFQTPQSACTNGTGTWCPAGSLPPSRPGGQPAPYPAPRPLSPGLGDGSCCIFPSVVVAQCGSCQRRSTASEQVCGLSGGTWCPGEAPRSSSDTTFWPTAAPAPALAPAPAPAAEPAAPATTTASA